MKWSFWRGDHSIDHLPAANVEAAETAERTAKGLQDKTRADRSEVARLAERLRALRRENHFAEAIQATLSERHE